MSRKHICHITVLNPALHTRIFYKLALSQQALGYQVTIIGQDAHRDPYFQNGVEIQPFAPFQRGNFRRICIGWRLLALAKQTKADIITLHTPEILWVGFLLKFIFRKTVIYDVHEDYSANYRSGGGFLRKGIARVIQILERFSSKWLDGVSYAEISYGNLLRASEKKTVVLRNSFSQRALETVSSAPYPHPYMLYTGTIAKEWGLWETVDLWEKLNIKEPIHLVIAGFTHDQQLTESLMERIQSGKFASRFALFGGTTYLPYPNILSLIKNCEFGTAFYHPLSHIQGKIPTKFYEFKALAKPLVFTRSPFWVELNSTWEFGIPVSINRKDHLILDELNLNMITEFSSLHEISGWEEDEKRMDTWLHQITNESGQMPR